MSDRVLVDSSIWIDHFNQGDERLAFLLSRRRVVMHAMIAGEIALGSLRNRSAVLIEIAKLPHIPMLSDAEVIESIESLGLFKKGVGLVDTHLLLSARAAGAVILSRDRRLHAQAERLFLAAPLA